MIDVETSSHQSDKSKTELICVTGKRSQEIAERKTDKKVSIQELCCPGSSIAGITRHDIKIAVALKAEVRSQMVHNSVSTSS